MMPQLFRDRRHAGRVLAAGLTRYAGDPSVVVLALPRGGIPVGFEVAAALGAPLHPVPGRKVGVPGREAPPSLEDRIVILVDDGLATGSRMRAAATAVRRMGPRRIVVAAPVAAAATCEELARDVDEVVCAVTPEPFFAVGLWYQAFSETTDAEARDLLARARAATPEAGVTSP